ncbi:hypothetical protein [Formosa algae]|uniref:hypothetical protein n=1 Tax=Formosa algae TaxID=225843 RepID=UPI000CCE76D4|nr:hypothetical protein [Formosa algae]PNW28285.1 hypothetical protein BKP44_09005 [Formosa algae]
MTLNLKTWNFLIWLLMSLHLFAQNTDTTVQLTSGPDESAGGAESYIITTALATYYLDKSGGGLSSMTDKDGVDWIGFHNKKGSGHKGEYRGFPNAIHKQDGDYFHAMNSGTEPSHAMVDIEQASHIRITFTSENKQWEGQWDFYPERCDFTMTKISKGYHYWVQYEGVPNGTMDTTDFWYASADTKKHPVEEPFLGDLPEPEWMAFGDKQATRILYLLHHENDEHPDNYVSRPDMTVLGFGRQDKDKFLDTVQTFSIGFIESTDYAVISETINKTLEK